MRLSLFGLIPVFLAPANVAHAKYWPKQPLYPILKSIPTIFNDPPYGIGRTFSLPHNALFFKSPEDLRLYDRNKISARELIELGDVVELRFGRKLIAEEEITSFRGRVFDQRLGSGYIVMKSIF